MGSVKNVSIKDRYCHDCKKIIEIQDNEFKNGVLLAYETNLGKLTVFKCNECFSRNPGLTNYQQCEVYSRIVGYYRPVSQWNKGKDEEFRERKEFKVPEVVN